MKGKFFLRMQEFLGATRAELFFVMIILSGLTGGVLVQKFSPQEKEKFHPELAKELERTLDSLAELEKSTNTGIDSSGNPIAELAAADTIVKDEENVPSSKKKEIPSGKIDINSAGKSELMKLPGVGEATAETIIEYRKLRKFSSPEDIMNVKGIGEKKFEKMQPFIIVK